MSMIDSSWPRGPIPLSPPFKVWRGKGCSPFDLSMMPEE
jgi:hypothetical protein